ncbi:hypothetical protein MJ575_14165 [Klebsiella pneumoniae]|nr:hypothetical protein MJ575_14165 [Klebsiella pneumoniae]
MIIILLFLNAFCVFACLQAATGASLRPLKERPNLGISRNTGEKCPNETPFSIRLPYQAPPFDVIDDSHYRPAFDEGVQQQRAEIRAIIDNPLSQPVRQHARGRWSRVVSCWRGDAGLFAWLAPPQSLYSITG